MSEPVVVARGLAKRFGRVQALEALDLEIADGSIFGLLGPNGAGKSTTFGVLCGWLRPTAGEARVLGVPSRRVHRLRGRVSALPQDATFPPQIAVVDELTHYGRLAGLTRRNARIEAERALEQVGLASLRTRRGAALSHGQRKRVGLAQALIGEPRVIFLDEPTSGLDPSTRHEVHDLIRALARHATVVLSSHDLAEVEQLCTHGAILDRGRCIAAGSIEDLRRRGSEVTIELGAGAAIPWDALRARLGASIGAVAADAIRIELPGERDPAEVIADALRILLDAGTPILGVRRGTSLEARFLDLTRREPERPRST